jgi:sugar lactone lactonase YvrE
MQTPMSSHSLESVATFDHQVTGVTVSETGRIFVCFPRWTEDAPVSVAELVDGTPRPYPDEEWNRWRNAKKNEISPEDHWVCVQSVVADGRGSLWVLDPAAPGQDRVVPGGPKLVQVDLGKDEVVRMIAFGEDVAPQGSYLNDVRISPDGRWAYITESGAQGAIVVVDLEHGSARRVLDGHPSTQVEKDVVVTVDGKPLRRTDGRGVEFSADGIALSRDGRHLYWQALTGKTLYRIETAALIDESPSDDALGERVERVGENGVSDGLWIDEDGRMYISALEEDAIKVREDGDVRTLLTDKRLRWPDTFSEGPDGAIYVTASHIMDMNFFNPESGVALHTELFRIVPGQNAEDQG